MIGQIPARCRSATSFGPVCDQDSVMEFGLNTMTNANCSRIPLDTELGLGPGNIVLWRPIPRARKGHSSSPTFWPVSMSKRSSISSTAELLLLHVVIFIVTVISLEHFRVVGSSTSCSTTLCTSICRTTFNRTQSVTR